MEKEPKPTIKFGILETAFITIWGVLFSSLTTIILYDSIVVQPMQEEAVERNYAEWKIMNNKNGDTKFTWK
jgi:hypothetical protein